MQTHILDGQLIEVKPLAEPVVGVRCFTLNTDEFLLASLAQRQGELWHPGVIKESICSKAPSHGPVPPVADCSCGIWSCKSRKGLTKAFPTFVAFQFLEDVAPEDDYYSSAFRMSYEPHRYNPMLTARIEQWGIVISHEWGYRSQYARIIPESICYWPRKYGRTKSKILDYLKEKYGQ